MQFGRGFVRIRLLADYHTRMGKYREAESYYRKAIDIQPALDKEWQTQKGRLLVVRREIQRLEQKSMEK